MDMIIIEAVIAEAIKMFELIMEIYNLRCRSDHENAHF